MVRKYNSTTHSIKQRKLRVSSLVREGALRITEPGPGARVPANKRGDPSQFSVVTPMNPQARSWKSKPKSYSTAQRLFDKGWLDDGKYRQIVDSAKKKGLSDAQIFKSKRKG